MCFFFASGGAESKAAKRCKAAKACVRMHGKFTYLQQSISQSERINGNIKDGS
jgi:hypothetical protein